MPVPPSVDPSGPESSGPESSAGDRGVLARRNLLRGGAVLAGAAGAVALSAVARPAYAADGQPVVQGQINDATSTTTLRVGGADGTDGTATLALRNADGPSLELEPLASDWPGDLGRGQIANTDTGPKIGLLDPEGFDTVGFLATEFDLQALPRTVALSPQRVVDTRNAAGRDNILNFPSDNFDSAGKLLRGKIMILTVGDATADVTLEAAFLNVVSVAPDASGYLTLYPEPEGARPLASTLNFNQGQTIANGTFLGLGTYDDQFVFTVFASQTTHVVIDLNGVILRQVAGPTSAAARGRRSAPGYRHPRPARTKAKVLGQTI